MLQRLPQSLKGLLLTHEGTLIALVLVAGGLGALWAYFWLESSRESLRLSTLQYESQQIRGDLYNQLKEVSRARLLEDVSALSRYRAGSERIDDHFQRLEVEIAGPRERIVFDYMRKTYETVHQDMDKIGADPYLLNQAERMKVLDPLYEEWMLAEFESALLIVDEMINQRRRELSARLRSWTARLPWLIGVPVALALALLVWSWRSLQRGFVRPMRTLTDGARWLSQGVLDHRIDPRGVTEVRRLGVAFNEMAAELSASREARAAIERQAALGSLVPVVAHNIRNPLASIRATAQVLDSADDAAELAESRRAIIDTVDRLERWVSALLSYLHPLKPKLDTVLLADVIDGALKPLLTRVNEKNLTVQRLGFDDDPRVAVDVDLFEQALYGLLNNAIEATPAGTRLRLALLAHPMAVELEIADQGPGIPFQPQPSELSPGPTTKRFGTGLGIPFAFKVCQAHDGELSFQRTADGTRVRVLLPLATSVEAAAQLAVESGT